MGPRLRPAAGLDLAVDGDDVIGDLLGAVVLPQPVELDVAALDAGAVAEHVARPDRAGHRQREIDARLQLLGGAARRALRGGVGDRHVHHRDGAGYVLYTELRPAEVRRLADAVNALSEPLSHLTAAVLP